MITQGYLDLMAKSGNEQFENLNFANVRHGYPTKIRVNSIWKAMEEENHEEILFTAVVHVGNDIVSREYK